MTIANHDNPRVRAYARATGAREIDHRFREWLNARMAEAADQNAGGFRFEPGGVPHIHDHAAFTAFLMQCAAEAEQQRVSEALGNLLHQVYQMRGMFDDADGSISRAIWHAEMALNGYSDEPTPGDGEAPQ